MGELLHRIRFIPTPVGNTASRCGAHHQATVHPHARGEHLRVSVPLATTNGSSPRPWGTQGYVGRLAVRNRFIPTPVGNTG